MTAIDSTSSPFVPHQGNGARNTKPVRATARRLPRERTMTQLEANQQELTRALAREWVKGELARRKAELLPALADTILTADTLDDLPEILPLIEGIIPQGAYGILNGRDSSYKSFEALDMALCLVAGIPWHGKPVTMPEDRPEVLYIAAEGARGLVTRIRAWEEHHGVNIRDFRRRPPKGSPNYRENPEGTPLFLLKHTPANLFVGPDAEDLVNFITRHSKIGFVIIDTLRRSSGGAQENGSDMSVIVDNICRIREATEGGTVLVIAHTQKDDRDTRGNSLIEDDADFVWHSAISKGVITMTNNKMKDGFEHPPIKFTIKPVAASLVLETVDPFEDPAGTAADAKWDAMVLEAVTLMDSAGQSATRAAIIRGVKDQIPEDDKAPHDRTIIRAIGNCKAAGTIVQAKKNGPYNLPEDDE